MGSAPKPSLLHHGRDAGAAKESLLRYDVEPEDVLDEETLAEDARRHALADQEAPEASDGRDMSGALSVGDLRVLADRVRHGESVTTLQKP